MAKPINITILTGYLMKSFAYLVGLVLALFYLPYWAIVNCLKPLWISLKNLIFKTRLITHFQHNLILYYVGCATIITLHLGLSLASHFHHIWVLLIPLTLGYAICLSSSKLSEFQGIAEMLLCIRGIDTYEIIRDNGAESDQMLAADQLNQEKRSPAPDMPPRTSSDCYVLTLVGYY